MVLYMCIAPRQGLTTPWGRNFYVNRNILSLRSFVESFKKIPLKSDFIQFFFFFFFFFHDFIHVNRRRAEADSPPGDKILMSTERPYHFTHLLQVSKKSL